MYRLQNPGPRSRFRHHPASEDKVAAAKMGHRWSGASSRCCRVIPYKMHHYINIILCTTGMRKHTFLLYIVVNHVIYLRECLVSHDEVRETPFRRLSSCGCKCQHVMSCPVYCHVPALTAHLQLCRFMNKLFLLFFYRFGSRLPRVCVTKRMPQAGRYDLYTITCNVIYCVILHVRYPRG